MSHSTLFAAAILLPGAGYANAASLEAPDEVAVSRVVERDSAATPDARATQVVLALAFQSALAQLASTAERKDDRDSRPSVPFLR